MNAMFSERARCAEHGLILDDAGNCTRCARAEESSNTRSVMGRAVVLAFVVVLALVGYRVVRMLFDGAPSQAAVTTANPSARLVVYTTGSCPACRLAKGWMDQNSVVYEERRVDDDDGARKELTALGKGTAVPTFVVGDEVLVGFDVQGVRLTKSLKEHGLR